MWCVYVLAVAWDQRSHCFLASFALALHEMKHVLDMLHAGRVTSLSGDTVLNRLASGTSLEDIAAEIYPDATNGPFII